MVVVVDIGNVLLRWNPRNLFRKVFADDGAMEMFLATACAMDWIVETDRAPTFQPALDARIAAYPQYARELRLFDERWIDTLGGAIHENVALLGRLRAKGDKLYSITNFCPEKFEIAREQHEFLDCFGRSSTTKRPSVVPGGREINRSRAPSSPARWTRS